VVSGYVTDCCKNRSKKKVVKKFTSTFGVRRSPWEKFFLPPPPWLISKYVTVAPPKNSHATLGQNPGSATAYKLMYGVPAELN
jgi:hypothetical protein